MLRLVAIAAFAATCALGAEESATMYGYGKSFKVRERVFTNSIDALQEHTAPALGLMETGRGRLGGPPPVWLLAFLCCQAPATTRACARIKTRGLWADRDATHAS